MRIVAVGALRGFADDVAWFVGLESFAFVIENSLSGLAVFASGTVAGLALDSQKMSGLLGIHESILFWVAVSGYMAGHTYAAGFVFLLRIAILGGKIFPGIGVLHLLPGAVLGDMALFTATLADVFRLDGCVSLAGLNGFIIREEKGKNNPS